MNDKKLNGTALQKTLFQWPHHDYLTKLKFYTDSMNLRVN